jgi:hypothetical protein
MSKRQIYRSGIVLTLCGCVVVEPTMTALDEFCTLAPRSDWCGLAAMDLPHIEFGDYTPVVSGNGLFLTVASTGTTNVPMRAVLKYPI